MTTEQTPDLLTDLWYTCGASVRGAAHEVNGQKNQDSFMIDRRRDGSIFVALSDGHGNHRSFRSDRGSALATQVAVQQLARFVDEVPKDFSLERIRRYARQHLPTFFLRAWQGRVLEDLRDDPISHLEFAAFPENIPVAEDGRPLTSAAAITYGATLLALAVTPRYILFSQLGDGDILTVTPAGKVTRPLKFDPQIQGNATTSLCTINCEGSFRFAIRPIDSPEISLIMLSTDGYANSYTNDKDFRSVAGDLLNYFREGGDDLVNEHLETWLKHASRHGSGDDITAALISRVEDQGGDSGIPKAG
jgi:serine/threonine protein phosphatase PrpC